MSDDEKAHTEHEIELEGRLYVCYKREVPDDLGREGIETRIQYSFDRGSTWHPAMADAYQEAKRADALVFVGGAGGVAGEYEAFVLALLHELGALEEGERLILARLAGRVTVIKEQAVLAVRASTIKDIDLRMEDKGG